MNGADLCLPTLSRLPGFWTSHFSRLHPPQEAALIGPRLGFYLLGECEIVNGGCGGRVTGKGHNPGLAFKVMYVLLTSLDIRAQELCESRCGRPGFPSLISKPTVSVDVKQHFNNISGH